MANAGGAPPVAGELWGAAALLVAIAVGAVIVRRRRPWLAFGAAWGAVALLPVIGLLQVGTQAVADRYAYLTLVGPFVALTWEADRLCERLRLPPPVVVVAALTILLTYGVVAHRQAAHWQSSHRLYTRALEISPNDVAMLFNLGNAELDGAHRRRDVSRKARPRARDPAGAGSDICLLGQDRLGRREQARHRPFPARR